MAIEVDDGRATRASFPPPSPQHRGAPEAAPVEPSDDVFEAFFRLEYPRLVVLLSALTGRRAIAEELSQEAMLRASERWDVVARFDRPGAWVRRVAINLAASHRSRRRSEERSLERLGRQRPPSPVAPTDGEFWALVRRLPRRQAAAVTLHYLEDRSVADVAAILGCAEATAKVHLHKGRAALVRLLEHQGDGLR